MSEDKVKKPNIFKRAFKYMKDDLALDKDMKEFALKIANDELDPEDITEIDLYEIGEKNDVTEDERIQQSFTRGLDAVLSDLLNKHATDGVYESEAVIHKVSNIFDAYEHGDDSKRDKKLLEKVVNINETSKYIYNDLSQLATKIDGLKLQRDEFCFLVTPAIWKEEKTQTKRVNYGGVGLSLKVVKGVYVRTGTMGVQPVKESYLQEIIKGNMYITNKRIIFESNTGIKAIEIKKIMKVDTFKDAIAIHKGTVSPALIFTEFNKPVLTLLIDRIFEQYHA